MIVATQPPTVEPELLFRDSFDPAAPGSDLRDLNSDLSFRQQSPLGLLRWRIARGVWFDGPLPDASVVHREGPFPRGFLLFENHGAVLLQRPFEIGSSRSLKVAASVDPVLGAPHSESWVSLILSSNSQSRAWVFDPDVEMGFLVRSSGDVQVFSQGIQRQVHWRPSPPRGANGYAVALHVRRALSSNDRVLYVYGTVNEATFEAALVSATLPSQLYLGIGAHFHQPGAERSAVDWVEVSSQVIPSTTTPTVLDATTAR